METLPISGTLKTYRINAIIGNDESISKYDFVHFCVVLLSGADIRFNMNIDHFGRFTNDLANICRTFPDETISLVYDEQKQLGLDPSHPLNVAMTTHVVPPHPSVYPAQKFSSVVKFDVFQDSTTVSVSCENPLKVDYVFCVDNSVLFLFSQKCSSILSEVDKRR